MSDKPHGPVGERFLRHHYGPSGYVSLANRLRRIASGEWTLRGDEDHLRLAADLLAAPPQDEAVALLREVVRRYDDYRGKGVMPAPGEYQMVVGAIERIRAYLAHMGGREAK